MSRSRRRNLLAAGVGVLTLAAAACGSSSHPSTSATTAKPAGSPTTAVSSATTAAPSTHSGTVDVLYAGSLVDLMQKAVDPGFHTATGYTDNGFSGGSSDLASDIKGKVKQGDVFVSASPSADKSLEGAANGNWVSWYATFASSALALGYNPKSRFAAALKTKPWYEVVTEPGFRLGLTPPDTDPKGVLAVKALDRTATARSLPALTKLGTDTKNQFPETNLEGEVESGQLDAGFFYLAEADSAGIPTVPLTGVELAADYTITVLDKAPHATAAAAFVNYLLGSAGRAEMKKYGFSTMSPPEVTGSGVPAALSGVVPGS
jgi:molybdate/tungstate transport system substrate-binding protein